MSWQLERRMSSGQYAAAICRLGLNKAQAGRFLGVSVRTSHRYYDGDSEVPEAHALLLRSLIFHNEWPLVPRWSKEQG
jgi:hypothetical protein